MDRQLAGRTLEIGLVPAADRFNANPATDVIDLSQYKGVRFILFVGAGGTGTATLTVEECDQADAGGTNTARAFRYRRKDGTAEFGEWQDATASGFTTTAGADEVYEVDIQAGALEASSFVRLQLTEVANDPVDGCVLVEPYGARYATEPPVGALAS